jgi:hypothetical protein
MLDGLQQQQQQQQDERMDRWMVSRTGQQNVVQLDIDVQAARTLQR